MNIEELKAKHGRVYEVIVPLDDEENGQKATFYLKKPDGTTRKMISKLAGGATPEKAVIAGFKALHIGGDAVSILETNEDALISATDALAEILTVQKAIIKKN